MLDAGIAVSYSERDWGLLIDILTCFLKYDGVSAAKLMVEAADEQEYTDVEAFGREIHSMVEMARDEPTFFDKIGECVTRICKAACLYRVKMQAGFASIALVEGRRGHGDRDRRPHPGGAAREKLLVQQSIKRAGRNMLGRDPETGHLTNDKPGQTFDDWKKRRNGRRRRRRPARGRARRRRQAALSKTVVLEVICI